MFRFLKEILIFIVIYAYVYSPPLQFISRTPAELLVPISCLYLFYNNKFSYFISLFLNEILILLLLVFYTIIRNDYSSASSLPFLFSNILLLICAFPVSFSIADFIIINLRDIDVADDDLIVDKVLLATVAAALISCFLIINPKLASITNNFVLSTNEFTQNVALRSFGFSASLTYSFAIAQGVAAAIILQRVYVGTIKLVPVYVIAFSLLTVSAVFNARIGLVPILLSISYFLIIKFKFKMVIMYACTLSLIYYMLFNSPYTVLIDDSLKWSMSFFTETLEFITMSGRVENNTYDTLFNEMFFLPNSIFEWVFGTGENIFLVGEKTSDVGYVLQLYFGGLIYLGILALLIKVMFQRLNDCGHLDWFKFIFLTTVLICNIKGNFIYFDVAFRMLVLLYVGYIYCNKQLKYKY